jgi:hypothetical protein
LELILQLSVGEFTKAVATVLPTLPHGEELGIGTITLA